MKQSLLVKQRIMFHDNKDSNARVTSNILRENCRDTAKDRWPNDTFLKARHKAKPQIRAQRTSKITGLAPKIGSCTNSNSANILVL